MNIKVTYREKLATCVIYIKDHVENSNSTNTTGKYEENLKKLDYG